MSYEDRISIATPEGVDLEVTLAGVGSRFVAFLIDQAIQWGSFVGIMIAVSYVPDLVGVGRDDEALGIGLATIALLAFFALQVGYPILFETLGAGRTPGKRLTGLRVVKSAGGPVTLMPSIIRTILRIVDMLPGVYLVGIVVVLVTRRNQRLGDLAADTIVIRERLGGRTPAWSGDRTAVQPSWETLSWDVSAVTSEEISTVRRFLERRTTLTDEARARLARELAGHLRAKVVGPPDAMDPEAFLVELAAAKSARG